jgi:signal peptidase II
MPDLRLKVYGWALAVAALDRLTKWIIESQVSFLDTYRVVPGFFDIVHSQNRGVAFGLFNDSTSEWRTALLALFSIVAVVAVGAMLWRPERLDRKTLWGFVLVLGGAAGNVFDRLVFGRVTDFLELYVGQYHWPTFNVADTAIVIGCGLLLLDVLRPKSQAART